MWRALPLGFQGGCDDERAPWPGRRGPGAAMWCALPLGFPGAWDDERAPPWLGRRGPGAAMCRALPLGFPAPGMTSAPPVGFLRGAWCRLQRIKRGACCAASVSAVASCRTPLGRPSRGDLRTRRSGCRSRDPMWAPSSTYRAPRPRGALHLPGCLRRTPRARAQAVRISQAVPSPPPSSYGRLALGRTASPAINVSIYVPLLLPREE